MSAQQQPAAPPNPVLIFSTVQGYQRVYALKAAVDLDLFTAIAKGSQTRVRLRRSCRRVTRGTLARVRRKTRYACQIAHARPGRAAGARSSGARAKARLRFRNAPREAPYSAVPPA